MVRDWSSEIARARAAHAAGRSPETVRQLLPALTDPLAPDESLRLLAAALRATDRTAEAVPVLETLTRRQPASAMAEHNLAAALGDCDRAVDSEAAARRALTKGGRAPETSLVLGRALVAQGRLDEAEVAFRSTLALRADFLPGIRDLAQLAWMRDGEVAGLMAHLRPLVALAQEREDAALLLSSILRDTAGDEAALDSLAPWLARRSVDTCLAAAAAASGLDPSLSLDYARRALEVAPSDPRAELAVCSALIASGRPEEAMVGLERRMARDPGDQYARGLLQAAWRTAGDCRALTTADYDRLVRVFRLDEAVGADRDAWLNRTAAALRRLHPFRSHPFQQSVRNGAQSRIDPRAAGDPDIDHLFEALRGPVDTYIAEVRPDWHGRPAADGWRIAGRRVGVWMRWRVRSAAAAAATDRAQPPDESRRVGCFSTGRN